MRRVTLQLQPPCSRWALDDRMMCESASATTISGGSMRAFAMFCPVCNAYRRSWKGG